MQLGPVTLVAIYLTVWWVVLFAVLPVGTQPEATADPEAGGWRGVPQRPQLLRKLLLTTLISAVIWAGAYTVIASDWLSFRSGWLALPER